MIKKIIIHDYKLIVAYNKSQFEDLINDNLKNGYELVGNFYCINSVGLLIEYYQPMAKIKDKL